MNMNSPVTRRTSLALFGAAAALPFLPRTAHATMMDKLALYGPPAGPSVTVAHAVASGGLADIATKPSFTAWRTPDELRAGLTSGQVTASVVPVQLAANLYNRGFPIRLANIMTEGLLYVLSEDKTIGAIPDLRGRRIAVPFKGDTPEILFTQLLRHHGIEDADIKITYVGTPVEAVQLLFAGRADAALVVEPSASAAMLRGRMAGKDVARVIDMTDAWAEMTGGPAVLPMAGLAVTRAIFEQAPEAVGPLRDALRAATREVLADPAAAAANAAGAFGLPAPVIAQSIQHSRLVARDASDIRPEIEAMFRAMAGPDFARLGGAMPDDKFYL